MKAFFILFFSLIFLFILFKQVYSPKTQNTGKYWYMYPEQQKRFLKIDSLKEQHQKMVDIYQADWSKYDSLRPLIKRNSLEWELAINDAEYHAWRLFLNQEK